MHSDLHKLIRTREEAFKMLSEIEMVSDALYQNNPDELNSILENKINKNLAEYIKRSFETGIPKPEFLNETKESIKKMPVISLTISFDPSEGTLTKLTSWAENNLAERVIFDISKNESLVGGAIVISRGNYLDLSLRSKIIDYFKNQKEALATYFK